MFRSILRTVVCSALVVSVGWLITTLARAGSGGVFAGAVVCFGLLAIAFHVDTTLLSVTHDGSDGKPRTWKEYFEKKYKPKPVRDGLLALLAGAPITLLFVIEVLPRLSTAFYAGATATLFLILVMLCFLVVLPRTPAKSTERWQ